MSRVDYSKWDKMASEMSDSEGEDNSSEPTVTTFDKPQSVTFGGNAATRGQEDSEVTSKHLPASSGESTRRHQSTPAEHIGTAPGCAERTPVTDEQLSENGAQVFGENGRLRYVWRQTRAEVMAVIPVPSGTRAGDVEIHLNAKPETLTEGVADRLLVTLKGRNVVMDGELTFQAKLEEDIEWELKDFPGTRVAEDPATPETSGKGEEVGTPEAEKSRNANVQSSASDGRRRGLEVTLRKHCLIPNVTVWWKSLLKGDPEIDVSSIQGRAKSSNSSAWEEAMGMFKAKMAERKKAGRIPIDTED